MKIICLGDSFTRGLGVSESQRWFSLLAGTQKHTFINKAINGDTLSGMLSRFQQDVISESPNYVLITGGTNDFICGANTSQVLPYLMAMVHQAFHNGIIPIIAIETPCIPSAICSQWAAFADFSAVAKELKVFRNKVLLFSKTFGADYIDFYGKFPENIGDRKQSEFYLDGLHLTAEGHQIVAKIAAKYFSHILP